MPRPISASRLVALSLTTLRRMSNVCKNQMTTLASRMIVNARSRKSFAFSQSSRSTFFGDGMR